MPVIKSLVSFNFFSDLTDRVISYMAMALGLDYWHVPELTSFLHGDYSAESPGAVKAVSSLVVHLLRAKGMGHLVVPTKAQMV
jgi:hypothetical protein